MDIKRKTKSYKIVPIKGNDLDTKKIRDSADAYNYMLQFYHEDIEIYESFFLLCLTRANTTRAYMKISQGGTTGTVVDPKILAKYAIDTMSSGVILCHNHPSGNLIPSKMDIEITNKIKNGLKLFDVNVLDHIIISPNNEYYSFCDEGMLME